MTFLRLPSERHEEGTALVEFVWLGMLLLVPLVYLILYAFQVQRGVFAVTEATRAAGRAYVTAGPNEDACTRAYVAADLAMRDHGMRLFDGQAPTDPTDPCKDFPDFATCVPPCTDVPGAIRITLHTRVHLTGLEWLGVKDPGLDVIGHHDEVFDRFTVGVPK